MCLSHIVTLQPGLDTTLQWGVHQFTQAALAWRQWDMHGKRTWATVLLRGEHPARLAFQLNAVQIQNIERKIILSLIIKKRAHSFSYKSVFLGSAYSQGHFLHHTQLCS